MNFWAVSYLYEYICFSFADTWVRAPSPFSNTDHILIVESLDVENKLLCINPIQYFIFAVEQLPDWLLLLVLRVVPHTPYEACTWHCFGLFLRREAPAPNGALHTSGEGVVVAAGDREYGSRVLSNGEVAGSGRVAGLGHIPHLHETILRDGSEDGFGGMEKYISHTVVVAGKRCTVLVQN